MERTYSNYAQAVLNWSEVSLFLIAVGTEAIRIKDHQKTDSADKLRSEMTQV
jgi:hypothetical protein